MKIHKNQALSFWNDRVPQGIWNDRVPQKIWNDCVPQKIWNDRVPQGICKWPCATENLRWLLQLLRKTFTFWKWKQILKKKTHFENESSFRNPFWKWKHPFEIENCLPDFFLNYRSGIYWVRLYKKVTADWFLSASSWIFLPKNTTQESLCNLKSCCYVNSGFMLESLGTLCNIIQQALGLSSCSLI